VPVTTIADLQHVIGAELAAVQRLTSTTRRSNAVGRLVLVALRLIEVGEHEQRLDLIEQRLNAKGT
jgi:hypothetical protein